MTDYGDGPERGNAQTWAFMAAECARLLRERDEARREVNRLRAEATGEAARAMMLEVDLDNARAEVERLRPFHDAVINAHNGYDSAMVAAGGCRKPETPADAIRELVEEAEAVSVAELEIWKAEVERLRAEPTDA